MRMGIERRRPDGLDSEAACEAERIPFLIVRMDKKFVLLSSQWMRPCYCKVVS